jgi:hypothetical protein
MSDGDLTACQKGAAMQNQDRDWALKQLGVEIGINPYELMPLKELLIRALQSFPKGATVTQIKTYFRDRWGLDIPTRRLTVSLSHLRPAGIHCGPGRVWRY